MGFCFFKQKTAYEMRISDWSSDVCSSDLHGTVRDEIAFIVHGLYLRQAGRHVALGVDGLRCRAVPTPGRAPGVAFLDMGTVRQHHPKQVGRSGGCVDRSEEHTSELQSLMRISYAVFCLKKKKSKKE